MEHNFVPSSYHITLGRHSPVLHVSDGDSIVTTTVDSRGCDAKREQVATRGNPQTGPFYIDGAEPGGLFFLGDGHAAQGDGEIVGSGIEISMDVRVTLRVIKGKTIGWPRGENSD